MPLFATKLACKTVHILSCQSVDARLLASPNRRECWRVFRTTPDDASWAERHL